MRHRAAALAGTAVLVAVAGCGGTKTVTRTVTVDRTSSGGVGAPQELAEFGHVKSLTRSGRGYRMRFDPAWFTSGVTANTAAAEDGVVEPGEPVPNDNYVVDDGHRLLIYKVPANARVLVLKDSPTAKPITVAQLAEIVAGKQVLAKPLWEPLSTGVWIRVRIDSVRSIEQQYHP